MKLSKKSYQNYFHLKLSSFLLFLFADSKSLQKQTPDDILKYAVNEDFEKLKQKNLIRIKSCNASQNFKQFSENFYNSCKVVKFKLVGQKSDSVINMELFVNVFVNYWKGWRHEVKKNSKIKVYYLYLWGCGLSFPRNLDGKSNIRYLIGENFVGEKLEFSSKKIVPNKNFSQWKTLPAEHIFPSGNQSRRVDNILERHFNS